MVYRYNWLLCALVMWSMSFAAPQKNAQQPIAAQKISLQKNDGVAESPFKVRVLLHEWDNHDVHLACDKGFVVRDIADKKKQVMCTKSSLSVGVKNGHLHLNGKKCLRSHVYILPKEGCISFEEKTYSGSFLIVRHKNKTLLINVLDLEDYVCSVLRTESWPGWPLEVNKVFASASRSYVIDMVQKARKKKQWYHVKNTNEHQTYTGIHSCPIITAAVKQTEGVFLSHEEKPILAMFDSCCGGVIPAHIADFNFNDAPYLARPYACTHCKKSRIYSWEAEYNTSDFEEQVREVLHSNKKLKEVKVCKKDKAGLVQKVALKSPGHTVTISGKKMYSLIGGIKSFCFTVRKKAGKIVIAGRGYGHHIGLCQWGAREMVREGWHYKRILQFYYPGTQFMKLA